MEALSKTFIHILLASLSLPAFASQGSGGSGSRKAPKGWEYANMAVTDDKGKVLCKNAAACKKLSINTKIGKPVDVASPATLSGNQTACFGPAVVVCLATALVCMAAGGVAYDGVTGMIRDGKFELTNGAKAAAGAAAAGTAIVATMPALADIFLIPSVAGAAGVSAILCGAPALMGAGAVHVWHLWFSRGEAIQKR